VASTVHVGVVVWRFNPFAAGQASRWIKDVCSCEPVLELSPYQVHAVLVLSLWNMPMNANRVVGLVWLCLCLSGGPAFADFADGLQAFDGGDYQTARENWLPLAEAGDADAQAAIAGMFRTGTGVAQDFVRAAHWYRAAADQGHVQAQLNLGELYAKGHGVVSNPVQAMKWLGLAAASGHAWAIEAVNSLSRDSSSAEVSAAKQLINQWKPK
tara:strand:+ start:631 stop:1266 length:636 start_codon:yes stop_codon:yes gene_type:complete